MSLGLKPERFPVKTPSITYKGALFPIVARPRILTVGLEPGAPFTTVTPAARPCSADSAFVIGTAAISFELTVETAPVTLVLF
ncbi:hypothetical protein D3C86_1712420 [compost metagenome]